MLVILIRFAAPSLALIRTANSDGSFAHDDQSPDLTLTSLIERDIYSVQTLELTGLTDRTFR